MWEKDLWILLSLDARRSITGRNVWSDESSEDDENEVSAEAPHSSSSSNEIESASFTQNATSTSTPKKTGQSQQNSRGCKTAAKHTQSAVSSHDNESASTSTSGPAQKDHTAEETKPVKDDCVLV